MATAQRPDWVILDGEEYALSVNPLESYFSRHPKKRPQGDFDATDNWRGYEASFAIAEGRLVVTDVSVDGENRRRRSVMSKVFPGSKPVVARWFSGHLVIPKGELVKHVHMGYGSEFSSYILVTVSKGLVRERISVDREEFGRFRRRQFEAFKKTAAYRQALTSAARDPNESLSPELTEEFLYQFLSAEYLSILFE
jgi:hypothetical protein